MPSLAIARLESTLQGRRLDHTLLGRRGDDAWQRMATDWAALDTTLAGGWRCGELSEVTGPRSSGRTRVLLATIGAATRRGEVVGVVDAFDRFDPRSAEAMGVVLDRVLWVRGPSITVEHAPPALLTQAVLRAVRAFDLIVRAGGFAVVALDLADVAPRIVHALPAVTWLRLARAIEGRGTAALLLGDAPMGRSAGGVSLRTVAAGVWRGTSPQSRRCDGLAVTLGRRDA